MPLGAGWQGLDATGTEHSLDTGKRWSEATGGQRWAMWCCGMRTTTYIGDKLYDNNKELPASHSRLPCTKMSYLVVNFDHLKTRVDCLATTVIYLATVNYLATTVP